MDVKKYINTKIIPFIPKYVKRQQIESVGFFFFAIFCRFNKQKILVKNENINVKKERLIYKRKNTILTNVNKKTTKSTWTHHNI